MEMQNEKGLVRLSRHCHDAGEWTRVSFWTTICGTEGDHSLEKLILSQLAHLSRILKGFRSVLCADGLVY